MPEDSAGETHSTTTTNNNDNDNNHDNDKILLMIITTSGSAAPRGLCGHLPLALKVVYYILYY